MLYFCMVMKYLLLSENNNLIKNILKNYGYN